MTLEQWHADANLRPQLAEILNHPVTQMALSIVRNGGLKPIVPIAGCDLIQYGAACGFRRDGYFDAIQNLMDLAKIKRPIRKDPDPWSDGKVIPEVFVAEKEIELPPELKPESQPAEPASPNPEEPPQPKL